ncbi:hypothetical protein BTA31_20800 [Bacillus haynesii]|uniref:Uncharacterized protein n=1 Tax=Bacillus haynesii TaxID=1925021 RepID=A0ABX3HZE8_9BACI|nr:hypothetical protein [Bacillus haynesii]OMI24845.1 hypothetical protein BTA31_20800 [Bacillus haynesii]
MINNKQIGVRSLDIQTGLIGYQDPYLDLNLRQTILIGKCASLASHLRGIHVIENFDGLVVLASKLKIQFAELISILNILEDIRYIRIKGSKNRPSKIEVLLDKFDTTYERLGEFWKHSSPQEFEQQTIEIIDRLSKFSLSPRKLRTDFDLDQNNIDNLLFIGKEGGFIDSFTNQNTEEQVIFSPIYMEENSSQIMNFLSQYDEKEVQDALQLLKVKPGFPLTDLNLIKNDILLEIMKNNLIQTPAIVASGGKVNFMFSPFTEVDDKQLLKHARYVVAAVRYGESFSKISALRSPELFLQRLLDRGYIGETPHSDIEAQYGVLRDCGLGRIEEIGNKRYRFYLADTDYARMVVKLAQQILFTDTDFDSELTRGIIGEAWEERKLLTEYEFNGYIPNLGNLKSISRTLEQRIGLNTTAEQNREINSVLNKLFQNGGEPDVF